MSPFDVTLAVDVQSAKIEATDGCLEVMCTGAFQLLNLWLADACWTQGWRQEQDAQNLALKRVDKINRRELREEWSWCVT